MSLQFEKKIIASEFLGKLHHSVISVLFQSFQDAKED